MVKFLTNAFQWLKSPKRWAAVFLVSVALLFLPSALMQKMGLGNLVQQYRPWISLCGLFSFAVLIIEFADWLRTPLKSHREQRDRKSVLLSLTPPEMQLIAEYFRQQTDTQYFSVADGIAGGLQSKGLIYCSTMVGQGIIPTFAYNLQPWVRETIRKHPDILRVFGVMLAREASTKA